MANLQLVWGYMATEEDWRGWGRVGWLQQGLPGRETLRSPGSCRSQTARKATKAKGRRGGMGWPLNNQRVLTFKCSYQHLALLSSLLFLPSFYVYGAWMVLDFLYCFPVGMRLWMLYNFLFCTCLLIPLTCILTLETHLWHGYVCKALCVSHRTLLCDYQEKEYVFSTQTAFCFGLSWH